MKTFRVEMTDGVVITLDAFNASAAMRAARRKMEMYAFGSTALSAKEVK